MNLMTINDRLVEERKSLRMAQNFTVLIFVYIRYTKGVSTDMEYLHYR